MLRHNERDGAFFLPGRFFSGAELPDVGLLGRHRGAARRQLGERTEPLRVASDLRGRQACQPKQRHRHAAPCGHGNRRTPADDAALCRHRRQQVPQQARLRVATQARTQQHDPGRHRYRRLCAGARRAAGWIPLHAALGGVREFLPRIPAAAPDRGPVRGRPRPADLPGRDRFARHDLPPGRAAARTRSRLGNRRRVHPASGAQRRRSPAHVAPVPNAGERRSGCLPP